MTKPVRHLLIDLTPMTRQTRWKDEFDDYACAERTLLFRLRDFISEEHMPDLST